MNQEKIKVEEDSDSKDNEEFYEETEKMFEAIIWKQIKNDIKELSKKEIAKQMFISGASMYKEYIDNHMGDTFKHLKNNPHLAGALKELEAEAKKMENKFWDEGSFIESASPEEAEQKVKTINMKHDEDVNYNCQSCNKKISAHNRDWHDGMCDFCFNKKYHPETER